jgi:hypothetical protein
MPNDITEIINRRFDRLKKRIEAAPTGGTTEDVRQHLAVITAAITAFYVLLDDIDSWKQDNY